MTFSSSSFHSVSVAAATRGSAFLLHSPIFSPLPTSVSSSLSLYQIDGQKLDLIYRAGAEDVLLLQFPLFCLSPPTHISRRRIIRLYYIERDEISSLRESMKRNKVRDRENVETTIRRSSLLSRRCPTFSISMFICTSKSISASLMEDGLKVRRRPRDRQPGDEWKLLVTAASIHVHLSLMRQLVDGQHLGEIAEQLGQGARTFNADQREFIYLYTLLFLLLLLQVMLLLLSIADQRRRRKGEETRRREAAAHGRSSF